MRDPQKETRLLILKHRLERTEARLRILQKVEARFPWIRLGVLVALLLPIALAFQFAPFYLTLAVIFLAVGVFAVVATRHQRVIDRVSRLKVFGHLLASHIARLQLNWPEIPPASPVPVTADHPFSADLNITGERSLHQLLDTTASLGGSRCLADWLLDPIPQPDVIENRRQLVSELLDLPAFRNRLELNGLSAGTRAIERWDGSALLVWLEAHLPVASLRSRLILLSLIALVNIILFMLNSLGIIPAFWLVTIVIYLGLQSLKFSETNEVFDESYALAHQLRQLRQIFVDLETTQYPTAGHLSSLAAPFFRGPLRPSTALRRIDRIVSAASLRNNPFLSLALNMIGPWDLFFAYQLEQYKRALRSCLPIWLEKWYEIEALTALANFASLNPDTTFPRLLSAESPQPVFSGKEIGHPLIPDSVRVYNDFEIQGIGEITIVTGSNMSGKSTFLRTVGINLVLAYAGTTVVANSLDLRLFRLFTSMNVTDSLNDGISFFYAEVTRLRTLMEKVERLDAPPLFYLIDEIFRGTNNRERQIGSHAYTAALAGSRGVGLISTHDLELAHLAETIPLVHNRHFREDIVDGKMVFDFKIRPGSSPTTNALKIMALAGLPIPEDVKNT